MNKWEDFLAALQRKEEESKNLEKEDKFQKFEDKKR